LPNDLYSGGSRIWLDHPPPSFGFKPALILDGSDCRTVAGIVKRNVYRPHRARDGIELEPKAEIWPRAAYFECRSGICVSLLRFKIKTDHT